METLQAIRERRSVRRFKKTPLTKEQTLHILEAARFAPSGLNNQPWRFYVVTDPEKKEQIAAQTRYSDIIKSAPTCIAVFLDKTSSYDHTKDVQAIGACIQNILLAAHDLKLGACWVGEILKKKEKVGEILNTPKTQELMAVIAIGHPDEKKEDADRKSIDELTTWI